MSDPITRLNAALEGRYLVERKLGEGGMATVYLARDLRHERGVAIKVLKPEIAEVVGAQRFLAEIRTIANLQHPHIMPLHDSGEADGFLFYVMPFVDGETLRQKLDREVELPVASTVRILRDVVDGLAYAHEHGVVHRDIKPGNIMISGRHAMIVDFGIAKAIDESAGATVRTTMGTAVGTPMYMSPEQAAGDPHVDHRADLYSAGVVGYELLTGAPPFKGTSPREILAAHVTRAPTPVRDSREAVPPALEMAVMRCLAKRPADRWASADELLALLEQDLTTSAITPVQTAPFRRGKLGSRLFTGAVLVTAMTLGAALMRGWGDDLAPLTILDSSRLTQADGMEIHPEISPDGRFVVYAAGTPLRMRLYLRTVAGGRTIPLTDDSTTVEHHPRYSPDGDRILFVSDGDAMIVSALGGKATRLASRDSASGRVRGGTWSPDGTRIALTRDRALSVLSTGGGGERIVIETGLTDCAWSPVADVVACVRGNAGYNLPYQTFGNLAPSGIVLMDLTEGAMREIVPFGAMNQSPVWSGDGRTLYFVSNRQGQPDIFSLPVSIDLRPEGEPVRITTGLNAHTISLAADGSSLAYSVFTTEANVWSLPIPTEPPGALEDAVQLTFGQQRIETLRPSRDRAWLYYDSNISGNSDIWRIALSGGAPEQMTDDPRHEFAPDASPDGTELAFHAFVGDSREIMVKSLLDGTVHQITSDPMKEESYPRWAPDGQGLAFENQGTPEPCSEDRPCQGVWFVPRSADDGWGPPEPIELGADKATWAWSSTLLAFEAQEENELVVYDADTGERSVVFNSDRGLGDPVWSTDDRTIYVKRAEADGTISVLGIPLSGGPAFVALRLDDPRRTSHRSDFSSDGEKFFFTLDIHQSDIWLARTGR